MLLIEDNAHGLGGSYKGKPLGSFGDFATQSFHATKNIQCGEGGALVINNSKFIERAEIIREKGTDRSRFVRGEIQKYQWIDKGSSYLLAESLAAILLGQLENFDEIQNSRLRYWESFRSAFPAESLTERIKPMVIDNNDVNIAHMFYLLISNDLDAKKIENYFDSKNVSLYKHYQPLHSSIAASQIGTLTNGECEISTKLSKSLFRIPLWSFMEPRIIEKITSTLAGIRI